MKGKSLQQNIKNIYQSLLFPPLVVFIAMLLVTFWSARASIKSVQYDQRTVINERTKFVKSTVTQRLQSYEQILYGGAGLFRASSDVNVSEWHDYISTFDVSNKYPGVQSIGYLKVIRPDEVENIRAYMQNQGIADFKIRPVGERDQYVAVMYIEPNSNSTAIGLDQAAEPNRKNALRRASESGLTTITPALNAMLTPTDKKVFQMYVPQYRPGIPIDTIEERKSALSGYIFAGFLSNEFFNKLFPDDKSNESTVFHVSSRIDTNFTDIYKSPNYDKFSQDKNYTLTQEDLTMYGQTWTFKFAFKNSSLTSDQRKDIPIWTWAIGITLGFLLSDVIYLLLKSRARELTEQREKAVDIAKDELLSLASHQLRTPATTVKQYLGMVIQGFAGDITPTQKNLLDKAYTGNERQLYIINEMLHVAKIDSGRIILARHETDLCELVKEAAIEQGDAAKNSGQELVIKVPRRPVYMNIDEHMLRMAIENLISNAVKYTNKPGKVIISLKKLEKEIIITVKDSGIGIAEADIHKLFSLFTRLDNEMTQIVGGTGVGLYLAKHLVELHGGRIVVESKINHGSKFNIYLPYKSTDKK